jgi:hypothetical protein
MAGTHLLGGCTVPDLASLKILARFVFLKSCAVNKNGLFLPFLSSIEIPPQVPPDWNWEMCYWTSGKYREAAFSPATMRIRRGKEERGLIDEASARGKPPYKEGDGNAAEAKPWQGTWGIILLQQ